MFFLAQVGEPETRFDHAVSRVNAYRRAEADCLFISGVVDGEVIALLVKAVDGPLNILAMPGAPPGTDLERLGVARLSFGSWPFRGAMGWFRRLVREIGDPAAVAKLTEQCYSLR